MRKLLRMGLVLGVALVATAGVAKAGGALGGPSDAAVASRETRLAEVLEKRYAAVEGVYSRVRRGKRGPRGARGPQGPAGPAGPGGPAGTIGSVTTVNGPETFICGYFEGGCSVQASSVTCPPGTKALSGGYSGVGIRTFISAPIPNGWYVGAANESEFSSSFKAIVVCGS